MRQHRRVSFAAPFVMVVGALAGCPAAKKPEPIHDNPPAPQEHKRTAEECRALVPDSACEGADQCNIDPECGSTMECRDGKWVKMTMACNPPPPSN